MRNYLKYLGYLVVGIYVSSVSAGSYEDFFIAIKNDNATALTALLDRGFDPNTRDPKGQPGLTIAAQERSAKALDALLARPGIDIDALNAAKESALMMAALKGEMPAAVRLLERGAKVNQAGWTALHYAATGPEPNLVKLLLQRGAEVDAASPNGTTPLMMAAQYGSEDSVALLLAAGASSAKRNQRDLRAADFARLAGRDALVERLDPSPR